jgi:hypothetical protein
VNAAEAGGVRWPWWSLGEHGLVDAGRCRTRSATGRRRSLRGSPDAPAAALRPAASVPRIRTQDPAMASTHHVALGVPGEGARK